MQSISSESVVLEDICRRRFPIFFFFNDTATTEIYTLSLHDALPISRIQRHLHGTRDCRHALHRDGGNARARRAQLNTRDRKSTRLNSSHSQISYAVFCLKKKKIIRPYSMA